MGYQQERRDPDALLDVAVRAARAAAAVIREATPSVRALDWRAKGPAGNPTMHAWLGRSVRG